MNLDGTRFVRDRVENLDLTVQRTSTKHGSTFFVPQNNEQLLAEESSANRQTSTIRKRKRSESDVDSILLSPPRPPPPPPSSASSASSVESPSKMTTADAFQVDSSNDSVDSIKTDNETVPLLRHYAHVCAVNIDETILENAELSGSNLAVKLMQMGADSILEEIHQNSTVNRTP